MKKTFNFRAFLVSFIFAALFIVSCGGGGGGNSIFKGNWLGAWSDHIQDDTGLFSVRVGGSGRFNGTAVNDICGSSGSASGSFSSRSTKLDMDFSENRYCYAFSVRSSGDAMTPYSNGYGSVVTAKYYDEDGDYIGSIDWGLYMERDHRSSGGYKTTVKDLLLSQEKTLSTQLPLKELLKRRTKTLRVGFSKMNFTLF